MTDKNIKKAIDLINKKSFDEAEKYLLNLRRERRTPYINYLLGYIHHINIKTFSSSE